MSTLSDFIQRAEIEGRNALYEHEIYQVLQSYDLPVPDYHFFSKNQPLTNPSFTAEKLVAKVVAPGLTHKSDAGGVVIIPKDEFTGTAAELYTKFPEAIGILVVAFMPHPAESLGGELIIGIRDTEAFGPVLSFGPGGTDAEHLHSILPDSHSIAALELMENEADWTHFFNANVITPYLNGTVRGRHKLADIKTAVSWALGLSRLVQDANKQGYQIDECEFNPLAPTNGKLIALDAVLRFSQKKQSETAGSSDWTIRQQKINHLLQAKSCAVIGVSAKATNPGRIIVQNLLRQEFDQNHLYIIKPDTDEIDGCRCYPNVTALPEKVDVIVISVPASDVPALLREVNETDKAEAIILISGGMAESETGKSLEKEVRAEIAQGKFILNGGNCLGVRSRPGKLDTFFIPPHKLPLPEQGQENVALISQSGAFALVQTNKFTWMNPRYAITTGNQTDLTVADYLQALEGEKELDVYGLYLEGLSAGTGLRLARSIKRVTAQGKKVIVYKAGRTAAGRSAVEGHTASIAGDYATVKQVLHSSGAVIAETYDEFADLLMLASYLAHVPHIKGDLFTVSNAGFECAGIADHAHKYKLLPLAKYPDVQEAITHCLQEHRLDRIVSARNPLDVTPMADDQALSALFALLQQTQEINTLVFSIVPFTPALASLPAGTKYDENMNKAESFISFLKYTKPNKPTIICVDAGRAYDPYCAAILTAGYPVMRSIDRTIRMLERLS